jgi:hypothetical protein
MKNNKAHGLLARALLIHLETCMGKSGLIECTSYCKSSKLPGCRRYRLIGGSLSKGPRAGVGVGASVGSAASGSCVWPLMMELLCAVRHGEARAMGRFACFVWPGILYFYSSSCSGLRPWSSHQPTTAQPPRSSPSTPLLRWDTATTISWSLEELATPEVQEASTTLAVYLPPDEDVLQWSTTGCPPPHCWVPYLDSVKTAVCVQPTLPFSLT